MNRKPFFAYRSFRKEFSAMQDFTAAGVNQFCVFPAHSTNSLGEPYSEYAPTWLAPNVYDFTPFDQQIEDVKKYDVDVFVMGDDWKGKFDFLKDYCEVVYLPRTPEISTTKIKQDMSDGKRG